MKISKTLMFALAFVVAASNFASRVHADSTALYKKLIEDSQQALVTVKCVLKLQGQGSPQDLEREFTAVMIDPKGLVLCSSVQLGTSRLFRRGGNTVTPTDTKVLIGDDTDGVEAKLVTSDQELDLSWIQIKEAPKTPYKAMTLASVARPELGARLLSPKRMDKFFDRAIVINEGLLGGMTKKPRELLVPTSSLEMGQANVGMPVYDESGAVIGVAVLQSPDPEDMDANSRGSADVLILPVAEVVKATERARTAKVEEEEEEDEEGAASGKKATTQPVKADDKEEEE